MTADDLDLASLIRQSDRIAWSAAAAEPTVLLQLLERQLDRAPAATVFLNLAVGHGIDAARLASKMRITGVGGAVTNFRFQDAGALDVLPANYSALPGLVTDGLIGIDVALVALADDVGGYNLSLTVDHLADAIPRARVVVGEINDQFPVTFGDTTVAAVHVDHVIRTSRAPPEVASRPSRGIEKAIGAYVASLIADGATIQVGLGTLIDAVLESLAGKRDLGVHSGTLGDRIAELAEAGVITNRMKPIDTGITVTATLLGSRKTYAWAHRNRSLAVRSPRYAHEHLVLRQIPKFVAINSAVEVDLTGQMNAEVAGTRHIGMIGGHADYMRGAVRSPGGHGIVAMESTARGGKTSRIVARLSGGIVSTPRSDADIVVTEYGIAELRGRTVSERARALIAIAHPDFRKDLEATAAQGLM